MEHEVNAMQMLDLMVRPAFCVKDTVIVKLNAAAKSHLLEVGAPIGPLLKTGELEYSQFRDGCLYLTLAIQNSEWGASVTRVGDMDVFVLEQEADQAELQAMALAAQELREPLTSVMTTADRLFPLVSLTEDPRTREQVARLNRGLFQILRVISNMSDAGHGGTSSIARMEMLDVAALLDEVFAKSSDLVAHTGLTLRYTGLNSPVCCLADGEKLERAVFNILSNAIKFTPKGGTIEASLKRRGNMLTLSVQDSGQGIPDQIQGSLHSRYRRQPGIEDSRFGIGLGMVLIRSAAAVHGGTVLIDQPEGSGTRITLTMELRQANPGQLRSQVLRVDYAGERDHSLIELSECLPAELYDSGNVN